MNFTLVSGGAAYMRLQAGEAKYSGTNTLIEYEIGKPWLVYLALYRVIENKVFFFLLLLFALSRNS